MAQRGTCPGERGWGLRRERSGVAFAFAFAFARATPPWLALPARGWSAVAGRGSQTVQWTPDAPVSSQKERQFAGISAVSPTAYYMYARRT
jgi:hypothetical protein